MTKYDWVFVGIRLYGIFLLAQAAMGVTGVLLTLTQSGKMPGGAGTTLFVQVIGLLITAAVGWILAFQANKLGGYLAGFDL